MKENWTSTKLENLFSFVIGGDWGKDLGEGDADYTEALCIRGSEFRDWDRQKGKTAVLRKVAKSSIEKRQLRLGDILVEISGGGPDQPVGRTVFIDGSVLNFEPKIPKVCTNFLRLVRLVDEVDKKFVSHFLNHFYKSGEVVKYQGGSNNLRNLRFSEYSQITIPLAPLPEQKRIVTKLDKLFAHHDQLKARLEKVPGLLKQFRQAVLTQAVTGKLTEEWRDGFPDWDTKQISSICEHVLGKMLDANKNRGELTPYLRNVNVRWSEFDLTDVFEMRATDEDRQKFSIQDGDILICEGGEPGRCAIWNGGENNFIFQKALHRLRCREKVLPEWIAFNLQRDANNGALQQHFTGTTIKHFTLRALGQYKIAIPLLEEQKEIVRRVESLFAVADRIEASYNTLKEKIDHLPQAILSKAFRGELVASEATQEAEQLLIAAEEIVKYRAK